MECLKNMNLCTALYLKLINSQDEILLLYSEVGAESLWLLNKACRHLWEGGFPESYMC